MFLKSFPYREANIRQKKKILQLVEKHCNYKYVAKHKIYFCYSHLSEITVKVTKI